MIVYPQSSEKKCGKYATRASEAYWWTSGGWADHLQFMESNDPQGIFCGQSTDDILIRKEKYILIKVASQMRRMKPKNDEDKNCSEGREGWGERREISRLRP